MIFLDQSGVGVTLPTMQHDLNLTTIESQWVMNAFFLTLSVLLLFCGRLSDHLGYRRVFLSGLLIFLLASIICASATNGLWIIFGRALQGVGGSLALSTYLILLSRMIPVESRGKALGLCAAFGSLFLSSGPLIGGFFSQVLSWRWIFIINIPIVVICIFLTFIAIPAERDAGIKESFDLTGLLFFILPLTSLVVALMEGSAWGWGNGYIIALFIISASTAVIFCYIERRKRLPLLKLQLFRGRLFFSGNIILLCTQAGALAMVFWALWLQKSLGFSPLKTGVALLPAGLPYIIASRWGGGLLDKYGPKVPLVIGTTLFFVGNLWVALAAPFADYKLLFLGLVIFGIGWGFIIPCGILTVMGSVKAEEHGMGSGVLNTMRQLGGCLGLAIVGAIITSYNNFKLGNFLRGNPDYTNVSVHQVNRLLIHASQKIPNLDLEKLRFLKEVAMKTYTKAFAFGVCSVTFLALISLLLAVFCIRRKDVLQKSVQ